MNDIVEFQSCRTLFARSTAVHNVSNVRSIESNVRAPVQIGNALKFGANEESRLAMVARAYLTLRQWNSTAQFASISYVYPSAIAQTA